MREEDLPFASHWWECGHRIYKGVWESECWVLSASISGMGLLKQGKQGSVGEGWMSGRYHLCLLQHTLSGVRTAGCECRQAVGIGSMQAS